LIATISYLEGVCGSNIALTRLYARAPRGKRAKGSIPRNRRKNLTLLASLSLAGIGETMIIEGAANAEIFEIYIEQILAPSLKEGQVVILDNLSIHKRQRVRKLIEARGCRLLFLPAYSPDFSPILRDLLQTESGSAPRWSPNSRGLAGGYRYRITYRN
jgi:transposase